MARYVPGWPDDLAAHKDDGPKCLAVAGCSLGLLLVVSWYYDLYWAFLIVYRYK